MAFKRKPEQIASEPEQTRTINKPEQPNPNISVRELTKSDKTFYDRAMRDFGKPYYNFDAALREEKCIREGCGAKFETNMSLLRYCSYQHFSDTISMRK